MARGSIAMQYSSINSTSFLLILVTFISSHIVLNLEAFDLKRLHINFILSYKEFHLVILGVLRYTPKELLITSATCVERFCLLKISFILANVKRLCFLYMELNNAVSESYIKI